MARRSPFRYFKTSPEIIRLAVMMYVRFPLSLRNVEDLLRERGIDICYEKERFLWGRFGRLFATEIRRRRFDGDPIPNLGPPEGRVFRLFDPTPNLGSPEAGISRLFHDDGLAAPSG